MCTRQARAELVYPDTNVEGGDETRQVEHRGAYGVNYGDSAGVVASGSAAIVRDVFEQVVGELFHLYLDAIRPFAQVYELLLPLDAWFACMRCPD